MNYLLSLVEAEDDSEQAGPIEIVEPRLSAFAELFKEADKMKVCNYYYFINKKYYFICKKYKFTSIYQQLLLKHQASLDFLRTIMKTGWWTSSSLTKMITRLVLKITSIYYYNH